METSRSIAIPRFASAERLFFDPAIKIPKEGLITQTQCLGAENFTRIDEHLTVKDDAEVERQKRKWLRKVVSDELHGKGYGVPGRGRRVKSQQVTLARQHIDEPGAPDKTKSKSFMDMGDIENMRSKEPSFIRTPRESRRMSKLYASNPALNANERRASMQSSGRRMSTYNSLPSKINLHSLNLTEKELESIRPKGYKKSQRVQAKVVVADNMLDQGEGFTMYEGDEDEETKAQLEQEQALNARRASVQVQHDWLLDEKLKEEMRKFQRLQNKLTIAKPDEDTLGAINKRMQEVQIMTRPKRDTRPVIDRIDPELRERILKVQRIPVSEIKREKRKKWKLRDLFCWSVNMVRFLLRCFRSRKKYYVDAADMVQRRKQMENELKKGSQYSLTPNSKSSLPVELRTALTTMPFLRDKKCISQVLWLLRTTKAFKALFPAEMEQKLAKHVAYEKYDDGRILGYQGRLPDRFYYILAGRVNIIRQFQLSTGKVTKSMRYLTKGMTTDPEEMEKQWFREDSIIAKGQVEVLLLEKEAFKYLLTSHQGPPVDFLKAIDLFEGFDPECFYQHTDAIEYKYYGQGKMILKDSNRTQWLYVVKSGSVKVVRRQTVVDSQSSNVKQFSSRREEGLGTSRYSSHASAMLGVVAKQKKFKELKKKSCSLPELVRERAFTKSPYPDTLGVGDVDMLDDDVIQSPVIYRGSASSRQTHSTAVPSATIHRKSAHFSPDKPITIELSDDDVDDDEEEELADVHSDKSASRERKRKRSATKLPAINVPRRSVTSMSPFEPHSLWLTKEKTETDALEQQIYKSLFPKKKCETFYRRAHLQLDVLTAGDVFGLDHLQQTLASEPQGFSLLSDGAEIVKISKRFFLQFASNNTMMKVELMYKEYLTEEEAKDSLYEKETWKQYKGALWNRITAPMVPPNAPNTVR